VEVYNGRLLDQKADRLAHQMAIEAGILMSGSDACSGGRTAFVEMGA
jgi:hypothetical protein